MVPCDANEVYVVCRDVTEHSDLIRRLQESERKYRLITERIFDVVWAIDMNLRFSFVSRSVTAVLGYEPKELYGISIEEFLDHKSVLRIRAQVRKRLEEAAVDPATAEIPFSVEMDLPHRDGHRIPMESISTLLLGEDGRPESMIGVARDITERRRAQSESKAAAEVLRKSEQRYKNLFEESPLALWEEDLSDLKAYFDELEDAGVQDFRTHFEDQPQSLIRCLERCRVIDVNKATLELFKAPSKEMLLGNLERIVPEEGMDGLLEEMVELAEGNWDYQGEIMQQDLTGEKKLCLVNISVVPGYEQDLGRVIVSLQDISRQRNNDRLAEIKYRIAESVMHAQDMSALFSSVHSIVSEYLTADNFIAGLLEEETDTLDPVYSQDQKECYEPIVGVSRVDSDCFAGSVIRSGLPLLMTGREISKRQESGVGKGRGVLPRCWLGVPMRSKNRVLGVLILQDYEDPNQYSKPDMDLLSFVAEQAALAVERKRYEDDLHDAMVAAEAASRSKSEFLANMSHEIRTPLTGIMGMAELIRSLGVTEEQGRYLNMLGQSGDGLLRLLNDILDFSKVEAGKLELHEEDFVVAELLDSVLSLFSVQVREKGLALEMEVNESVPAMLRGDHSRLRQILINLIGNGIKFTESGTVGVQVDTVRSEVPSENITLKFVVYDTGPGVPLEKQSSIFDSFTQADGSLARKFGGVGLGLAISNRLVSLMGGEISLFSEPGQGATFSFTIQLAPAACQVEHCDVEALQAVEKGGKKILLAEDNALNQLFMAKLLVKRGYEVVTVNNGQEALDALERDSFGCILMDVQMPVMDGEEATRRIRSSEKPWQDIPIIALTAHAMKGDRIRFIETGMNEYLSKPLSMDALEKVLLQVLGGTGGSK